MSDGDIKLLLSLKGATIQGVTTVEGEGETEGEVVEIILTTTDGRQVAFSADYGIEVERYD